MGYKRMSKSSITSRFAALLLLAPCSADGDLPAEHPLYASGFSSEIRYEEGETVRTPEATATAPSGSNRVFRDVGVPTYSIHRPVASKSNGVGLVICPGGAYIDVWLDREGHDLAIWLKDHGVTSLVLKYRTNGAIDGGGRRYSWEKYLPAVTSDARQAIRILRTKAKELNLDPEKIGISGFSAGGNLAMLVALSKADHQRPGVSGVPNFAGLFYPWLRTDAYKQLIDEWQPETVPPLFIMNAADDYVTPADRCVDFYARLLTKKATPELHIVNKGGHGFDLGDGRGKSAALWKQSFVTWLTDQRFAE